MLSLFHSYFPFKKRLLCFKDSKTTSFGNFGAPFQLWLSITRRLYLLVDEVALREGKQVVGDISSLR